MMAATKAKGILHVSNSNNILPNFVTLRRPCWPGKDKFWYRLFLFLRCYVRRYSFTKTYILHGSGLSDSSTAASFIRPSRSSDKPLSFLDALRKKYVSNEIVGSALSEDQIRISGKTVEEVGFEKIRKQLAILQELRFVILDGLCIAGIESYPGAKTLNGCPQIEREALSIIELDLSRNLLEEWSDVVGICCILRSEFLRSLKLEYVCCHFWILFRAYMNATVVTFFGTWTRRTCQTRSTPLFQTLPT